MTQSKELPGLIPRPDYSVLDKPEILRAAFYPNSGWRKARPGREDFMIPVSESVEISSRFYPASANGPVILYFHGNAETACEYEEAATFFNAIGVNLFVTDHRGYGKSDGMPTFSHMVDDVDPIFRFVKETAKLTKPDSRLFVMGRSLGCIPALEVASRHQQHLGGLIVESGVGNVANFVGQLGFSSEAIDKLSEAISSQISSLDVPALIIHGEQDNLIPVETSIALHRELGSAQKRLVILIGDHNNLMFMETTKYFSAIADFVERG